MDTVEKAQQSIKEAQDKLTAAADRLDESEFDEANELVVEAMEELQVAHENLTDL